MRQQLTALASAFLQIVFGADRHAPGFAMMNARVCGQLNRFFQRQTGVCAPQSNSQIARSDKQPVNAVNSRNGIDIFNGLRCFDLHDQKSFGVGLFGIVAAEVNMKVGVQPCAVLTAITDRRKLDRINQHLGFFRGADMRNHQTGRTVFQISVQPGFLQRCRTHHDVDIKQV